MTLLAAIGWLCALLFAVLWWRARRQDGPAPATVTTEATPAQAGLPVPEAGDVAVLQNAQGAVESVRRLKGRLPEEITRAHGRASVTVYKRIGADAGRWIYRAER